MLQESEGHSELDQLQEEEGEAALTNVCCAECLVKSEMALESVKAEAVQPGCRGRMANRTWKSRQWSRQMMDSNRQTEEKRETGGRRISDVKYPIIFGTHTP